MDKTIALYIRVSTKDQNTDLQTSALRAYCAARSLPFVEYVDFGHSGAKESRPALNTMLAAIQRREHRMVIVWKLDRLARSLQHLISLLDQFNACGVDFTSLTESMDTSTPSGRLIFSVIGALAEFERALLKERVAAGREAARERLRRRGSYRRPKDGKLVTSLGRPRSAVIDMQRVQTMLAGGMSRNAVAKAINVPETTLRDRLKGEHHGTKKIQTEEEVSTPPAIP